MHNRLLTLDGLRGVAALMVVLLHLGPVLGLDLAPHAYLMVDLFFLMSGFVLSAAFAERLAKGGQGVAFARLRLARLYPLSFIGLALGAIAATVMVATGHPVSDGPGPLLFLLGALFLPWLGGGLVAPLNGPLWSLQAEYWINVAYGFTARWLSDRRLMALVVLAGVALAAAAVFRGNFDGGFRVSHPGQPLGLLDTGMAALRVLFAFPLGILMHRLWAVGRLPKWGATSSLMFAPLALVLVSVAPVLGPAFDIAIVYLLFPLLILLGANQSPAGRAAKAFEVAGRLSFGVYVLHAPVLMLAKALLPAEPILALRIGVGLTALAVALALAWAAERWIDRPVRRWAAKTPFSRPTTRTASVQVDPVRSA